MNFFAQYMRRVAELVEAIDLAAFDAATALLKNAHARGGKVLLAGNGGSAAMASHIAVDLTKVAGIRGVTFNESDLITCFANDFGYEQWVAKALEYYADPEDVVVLISSSGRSPNIVNAAQQANSMKLPLVTFSGFAPDNPLRARGTVDFWVDSREYNHVEATHQTWLVAIVDALVAQQP